MFLETRPLETFHYPALGPSNRVSPVLSVRARAPASGYLAPSPFPLPIPFRSSRNTLWPFRASPYFPPTSSADPFRLLFTFSLSSIDVLFRYDDIFKSLRKNFKNCKNSIDILEREETLIRRRRRSERKIFPTRIKFETRKSRATLSYRDACKRRRGGWSKNWKGKREREIGLATEGKKKSRVLPLAREKARGSRKRKVERTTPISRKRRL